MGKGGKRKGAGRKRLNETVKRINVTMTISPETHMELVRVMKKDGLILGRALDLVLSRYIQLNAKLSEINVDKSKLIK